MCVCVRDREREKEEREVECVVEPTTVSVCLIPIAKKYKKKNLTPTPKNMVERILEEKNASTAAAKEFGSLRLNAGSASGASNSGSGNNNNASGSGDSGVGGSNVSCSNTDNSCSQSQSGEC